MHDATLPTPFSKVDLAPRDPVLGVTEAFVADRNPQRVNLGVGVYYDESSRVPVLDCIRRAEARLLEQGQAHGYLPIDGLADYDKASAALLLGADSEALRAQRAATVQTLGGTGALRLGADFIRRFAPTGRIWISDPSWENHRAVFEAAGLEVGVYPYLSAAQDLDFDAMAAKLASLPAGEVVLLHACCHNPTGVDLAPAQWEEIVAIVRRGALIPFLDIAYQGFAGGLAADGAPVRAFAETDGPLLIASSYSKSMSLYGERVGALTILGASTAERDAILSQLKRIARTTYSSPPSYGGKVVALVLNDRELRALWESELDAMRARIAEMRDLLASELTRRVQHTDWSFIREQKGMFSYSRLSKESVARLRQDYSIYALDTGRICVAALNKRNLDYVAEAISRVL